MLMSRHGRPRGTRRRRCARGGWRSTDGGRRWRGWWAVHTWERDMTSHVTSQMMSHRATLRFRWINLLTFLFPQCRRGLGGQESRDVIGGGAVRQRVITAVSLWPMRVRGRSLICRKKTQLVLNWFKASWVKVRGHAVSPYPLTHRSFLLSILVDPAALKPLQSAMSVKLISSCL